MAKEIVVIGGGAAGMMAAVFAAVQMGGKHNQDLLDQCVKSGSPLAKEIQRLRGQVTGDDDDTTRNSLRDSK